METYRYIARDFDGQKKEGVKQALTSGDVVAWLQSQSLIPISVDRIAAQIKKKARKARRKRIKSSDLSAICWQLTTMVEGGIPITEAVETIGADIENLSLQRVLSQIREKLEKGSSFSESIAEFPHIFNQISCAIILAGETSGSLAEALRKLAEYYDNRDKLAKKVKGAMGYPCFVLGFIILIVIFIMAFIVPRFMVIFDQIGSDLPAFTKAFVGFYDLMRFNLHYVIGVLLLTIVTAVVLVKKTEKGHIFFSKLVLRLPLFGKIYAQAFIAMFCRTMSNLIGAGVSVLEVFDILGQMSANDIIKTTIARTRESIVEGMSVSASMNQSPFFPNLVIKMVEIGEESGSLTRVLDRTSDYYERKVDAMINTLMSLLEPILIVTVGAIVLVVVLALYLPIFTMSDMAG